MVPAKTVSFNPQHKRDFNPKRALPFFLFESHGSALRIRVRRGDCLIMRQPVG